ncbi:hypothetical protein GCM10009657_05860 [Oryzihumus leptocrescens]
MCCPGATRPGGQWVTSPGDQWLTRPGGAAQAGPTPRHFVGFRTGGGLTATGWPETWWLRRATPAAGVLLTGAAGREAVDARGAAATTAGASGCTNACTGDLGGVVTTGTDGVTSGWLHGSNRSGPAVGLPDGGDRDERVGVGVRAPSRPPSVGASLW